MRVLLAVLLTALALADGKAGDYIYVNHHPIVITNDYFSLLTRFRSGDQRLINETPLLEWKSRLPRAKVGTNLLWIVQGDMAMDDNELATYALRYQGTVLFNACFINEDQAHIELSLKDTTNPLPFGIIPALDGKGARWKSGSVLKYTISSNTCASLDDYNSLVQAFETACKEWASICNITFEHVQTADGETPVNSLNKDPDIVFAVQASNENAPYYALSFFPYQPRERRIISFYTSFFDWKSPEMKTGICRHEIGHLLGFGHEHDNLSAGPDCPKDSDTNIVTIGNVYDADSVMHYHCGQNHNIFLKFTVQDKKAIKMVYGDSHQVISVTNSNPSSTH